MITIKNINNKIKDKINKNSLVQVTFFFAKVQQTN